MTNAAERTSSEELRRLIFATRSGGISHLVAALRAALGAEVGLIDMSGSTLATSPSRAIWDPDAVMAAVGNGHGTGVGLLSQPIKIDGEVVAYLVAQVDVDRNGLIQAAADLAALELSRLRAAQQGRRELLEGLVDDVLAGRVDDSDAEARLRAAGIDITVPHRLLVGFAAAPEGPMQAWLWSSIYSLMTGRPEPFPRILRVDHIIVFVPDDPMVERIAQTLLAQLARVSGSASVGISFAHTGGTGLRAAYYEAITASDVGAGVHYPARLDLTRLLMMTNTTVPLAELAATQLRPLIEHDRIHGSVLLPTLYSYLLDDREVAAMTKRLFIHRNTLRYRLNQIAEILDVDLESVEVLSSLWIAMKATSEIPFARFGEDT